MARRPRRVPHRAIGSLSCRAATTLSRVAVCRLSSPRGGTTPRNGTPIRPVAGVRSALNPTRVSPVGYWYRGPVSEPAATATVLSADTEADLRVVGAGEARLGH